MTGKPIDKNSPEWIKIRDESVKLWESKNYFEAASIWEENEYFTTAEIMYKEAAGAYEKNIWPKTEELKHQYESWDGLQRMHLKLGTESKLESMKKKIDESLLEYQLGCMREKPLRPDPVNIFSRIDAMTKRKEMYSAKKFSEELFNIGFELKISSERQIPIACGNGFKVDGTFKGPAMGALFERYQTCSGNLDFSIDKIVLQIYAKNHLSCEMITHVMPQIFGNPTRTDGSRQTMSNYAEWIR